MFDDLKEFLKELIKKVVTSRLFALSAVFFIMFCVLVGRLFKLQIVEGEEYQDAYIALAEKVIKTDSTRGNITMSLPIPLPYRISEPSARRASSIRTGTGCFTSWCRF